jgi:hypothetical protein
VTAAQAATQPFQRIPAFPSHQPPDPLRDSISAGAKVGLPAGCPCPVDQPQRARALLEVRLVAGAGRGAPPLTARDRMPEIGPDRLAHGWRSRAAAIEAGGTSAWPARSSRDRSREIPS